MDSLLPGSRSERVMNIKHFQYVFLHFCPQTIFCCCFFLCFSTQAMAKYLNISQKFKIIKDRHLWYHKVCIIKKENSQSGFYLGTKIWWLGHVIQHRQGPHWKPSAPPTHEPTDPWAHRHTIKGSPLHGYGYTHRYPRQTWIGYVRLCPIRIWKRFWESFADLFKRLSYDFIRLLHTLHFQLGLPKDKKRLFQNMLLNGWISGYVRFVN